MRRSAAPAVLLCCGVAVSRQQPRRRRRQSATCSARPARRTCSSSCRATARFRTATRRRSSASAPMAARGAACTLVYEDVSIDAAAVRAHRNEYRYRDMPAVIDAIARSRAAPRPPSRRRPWSSTPRRRRNIAAASTTNTPRSASLVAWSPCTTCTMRSRRCWQAGRSRIAETEALGCFIAHGRTRP